MSLAVVVLAAGRGVRMRSETPKVLHEAAGRPLLDRVLASALSLGAGPIVVVVGSGLEKVLQHLAAFPGVTPVGQEPQLGTGDAVRVALPAAAGADEVLVLSGDVPLLSDATLTRLVDARRASGASVAFLTAEPADAAGYGRVVRDAAGSFVRVVERKDATEEERALREGNAGVYAFARPFLEAALPHLSRENAQGEYYLPDVLALAGAGAAVPVRVADAAEILGVNSRRELAAA